MLLVHLLLQWYDLSNPARKDTLTETVKALIHARVEHPLRVMKRQFDFQKSRTYDILNNCGKMKL